MPYDDEFYDTNTEDYVRNEIIAILNSYKDTTSKRLREFYHDHNYEIEPELGMNPFFHIAWQYHLNKVVLLPLPEREQFFLQAVEEWYQKQHQVKGYHLQTLGVSSK